MNETQANNLGATLRAARKAKKITADALGSMLEPAVKANTITAWERGERRPNYELIGQLSEILDIDVQSLYASRNIFGCESVDVGSAEKLAEISYFYNRMNEKQRDAVLGVARAMVDC